MLVESRFLRRSPRPRRNVDVLHRRRLRFVASGLLRSRPPRALRPARGSRAPLDAPPSLPMLATAASVGARAWRVARAPKSFPPPPRAHPARMERPNRACRRNRTITRQSSPWCASKRPRAPPRAWCNRKSCDFATSRSAAATAMPMLWTVRVLVTRRAQQVKQPQHHRCPGGGPWRGARVGGQVNLPFPRYTYCGCFIGRSVPL